MNAAEEIAYLRLRVAELERLLGLTIEVPLEFNLTPSETRLFGLLYNSKIVTRISAMDALYGSKPNIDEPFGNIIDVYISKMRNKVRPFGVEIKSTRGRGWYLSPEAKGAVKNHLEQMPQ